MNHYNDSYSMILIWLLDKSYFGRKRNTNRRELVRKLAATFHDKFVYSTQTPMNIAQMHSIVSHDYDLFENCTGPNGIFGLNNF